MTASSYQPPRKESDLHQIHELNQDKLFLCSIPSPTPTENSSMFSMGNRGWSIKTISSLSISGKCEWKKSMDNYWSFQTDVHAGIDTNSYCFVAQVD